MLDRIMHGLLCRGRVRAARAWRDAERQQAAERDAAVRRILDQAEGTVVTPVPEPERSVMRILLGEVLTPDQIDNLEISPGVWLLPGPPP